MHHQVQGAGDPGAQHGQGQCAASPEREQLETRHRSRGRARLQRGERAVVPCIQGREQLDHLAAATLAEHQAIGAHAQGAAQKIAHRALAAALTVRRLCRERDHMRLPET